MPQTRYISWIWENLSSLEGLGIQCRPQQARDSRPSERLLAVVGQSLAAPCACGRQWPAGGRRGRRFPACTVFGATAAPPRRKRQHSAATPRTAAARAMASDAPPRGRRASPPPAPCRRRPSCSLRAAAARGTRGGCSRRHGAEGRRHCA